MSRDESGQVLHVLLSVRGSIYILTTDVTGAVRSTVHPCSTYMMYVDGT